MEKWLTLRAKWSLCLLLWCCTRGSWGWSSPKPRGGEPQVPCFFIFGDSLVDNGNNNGILTLARANYLPYGIDFPSGSTGRFTNGRTFVDILAQLLGFESYIPPLARVRGWELVRGVNYASGAAGIRDETGNNLGDHMAMNQQLENFARTVLEMRRFFRGDNYTLNAYLSKCIFYSGMGSNDYLNNYFMTDFYSTHSHFTPQAYAASLLNDYSRQLSEMYAYGARKIVVSSVGQIGCIPYELARYNNDGNGSSRCNEEINNAISIFNLGLKRLVDHFNKGHLPASKFVYLDSSASTKDLVVNARRYGFEVIDRGCCGVGKNNGQITCLPFQQPCDDRSKYIFWDAFHPTEVANIVLAKKVEPGISWKQPLYFRVGARSAYTPQTLLSWDPTGLLLLLLLLLLLYFNVLLRHIMVRAYKL